MDRQRNATTKVETRKTAKWTVKSLTQRKQKSIAIKDQWRKFGTDTDFVVIRRQGPTKAILKKKNKLLLKTAKRAANDVPAAKEIEAVKGAEKEATVKVIDAEQNFIKWKAFVEKNQLSTAII